MVFRKYPISLGLGLAVHAAVDALLAHNNVEVICDTVVESYIVKDGAFLGLVLKNAAGERSGMGFTVMESFCDKVRVFSGCKKGTTVTLFKFVKGKE